MASPQPGTTSTKCCGQAGFASLQRLWNQYFRPSNHDPPLSICNTIIPSTTPSGTILYLAYGSNLSSETFRGARGIKPLSSQSVHVPTLRLTFDLAGLPYSEPCFANTEYRDPNAPPVKSPYHKDRWHKGLIGVVYEVTQADYRTIIATEGGGASYQDVVVDCFPLSKGAKTVEGNPQLGDTSFKAHTLLCPRVTDSMKPKQRIQRPDPSYAQPSARYLKLITDGAEEHSLPSEYLAYLYNIRPYTITTFKQRVGKGLFMVFWMPIILTIFGLGRVFADKEGKIPDWLANAMGGLFKAMWGVYDGGFRRVFGDGERTIEKGGDYKEKSNKSALRTGPIKLVEDEESR